MNLQENSAADKKFDNSNLFEIRLPQLQIPVSKRVAIIFQVFFLSLYFLALYAYISETKHFSLTLQTVLVLIGCMFWSLSKFAFPEKMSKLVTFSSWASTLSFVLADVFIVIFVISVIDFSVTDRGIRRIFGMAVAINEAPPQVRMATEMLNKDGFGKNIIFTQNNGKDLMEIKLKYKPIPESVNFVLNGIQQGPNDYELTSDGKMLVSEGSVIKSMLIERGGTCWVRYSFDTKENRNVDDGK